MSTLYRKLAYSDHAVAVAARKLYRLKENFTLPAPRVIVKPMLWIFLTVRAIYWFFKRILICEPLFKAYCKQYGRRLRTGEFIHYISGKGDIVIGDNVKVDGKCSFTFSTRYSAHPTLSIGDHTIVAHNCSFTVAKQITIGHNCLIASDVWMFDSPGHPTDPEARIAHKPPAEQDIKPIVIGNGVWIGRHCQIFPGVTIGDNSVVAAGSAVMSDVPPNTVVAGYPARRINLQPIGGPKKDAAAAATTAPTTPTPSASPTSPPPPPAPQAATDPNSQPA